MVDNDFNNKQNIVAKKVNYNHFHNRSKNFDYFTSSFNFLHLFRTSLFGVGDIFKLMDPLKFLVVNDCKFTVKVIQNNG